MKPRKQLLRSTKPMKRRKYKSANTSLRFEVIDGKFRRYPDGREVCLDTPRGQKEYKERLFAMAARQGFRCGFIECDRRFQGYSGAYGATFEHDDLRGMGSARRDDRIEIDGKPVNRAVHALCNLLKGSKRA